MNLERYRYALRYLSRIEPILFKDICHDAYLNFHRKTGTDLFDQSLPLITSVVKNQIIDNWKYETGSWSERSIKRTYQNLPDDTQSRIAGPYEELIAKELLELCYRAVVNGVNDNGVPILELLLAGHNDTEICKILNVSRPTVRRYTKRLEMLNNPINGSKLKITKQIGLASWEKRTDRDDYQLEDENEFYVLYKHAESKEGLLVKIPARKTNPYIK